MECPRDAVHCGECRESFECPASMTNKDAVRCSYFIPLEMDTELNDELSIKAAVHRVNINIAFGDHINFLSTQSPNYVVRDSITGRRCT